jgi:hypothetical protein
MLNRLMTLLVMLAVIHPITEVHAAAPVGKKSENAKTRKARPTLGASSTTVCVGSAPQRCRVWTQQGSKLVGTGAAGSSLQGRSIDLSQDGNTALVGGVADNGYVGAAWVYTRSGNGEWAQQGSKLVGTGVVGTSHQGVSVALSADGNTAIVGGYTDSGSVGAAWVYARHDGAWIQQGPKLVGSGYVGSTQQGLSVALSGDGNTAIVGGPGDSGGVGAAWVYARSGNGEWTQQGSKLVGTGAVGSAQQGYSVALSADGNTALVGGIADDGGVGGIWVYARTGNGEWAQQGSKLVGTGAVRRSGQGVSVALSADGNIALVGGPGDSGGGGAAWVFTRSSNSGWAQQGSKLVGTGAVGRSHQGVSVALSADGNTAVVGGDADNGYVGAAWVYTRSGNDEWAQEGSKLVGATVESSYQGISVALSGDGNTAMVGGYTDNAGVGVARVYARSNGAWAQGSKLVGTGASGSVRQGYSVALSADGNTALVSAPLDSGLGGAAWVYTRSNGVWSQQGSKLVGTGAAGRAFQGLSAALSADGNTALVGADYDDGGVGAAWVYTRTNGVWSQQGSKLVGTGAVGTSAQGVSVALSADGNTAIVGGRDDRGVAGIGAAWVYTRTNGVWAQQGSKLVGTGAVGSSLQGRSIALSADGNTALVGGVADNGYVGAAWVYTRTNGVWEQQGSKLVGTGAVGTSYQGVSVALSADGNTAIVGGYVDNGGVGAAWVYTRRKGAWAQQGPKLVGTGAGGGAEQGYSVDLSADGNTAIVGAPTDSGHGGAAWVFTRSRNGVWRQQGSKLVGTGVAGHQIAQGYSVALSADANTALVGGPFDNGNLGAAWVFVQGAIAAPIGGSRLRGRLQLDHQHSRRGHRRTPHAMNCDPLPLWPATTAMPDPACCPFCICPSTTEPSTLRKSRSSVPSRLNSPTPATCQPAPSWPSN